MKILLTLLFSISGANANSPTIVYLCDNGKVKKYHYAQNCRGLSTCGYKTVKTTLEKAKKEGKTCCKWED